MTLIQAVQNGPDARRAIMGERRRTLSYVERAFGAQCSKWTVFNSLLPLIEKMTQHNEMSISYIVLPRNKLAEKVFQ